MTTFVAGQTVRITQNGLRLERSSGMSGTIRPSMTDEGVISRVSRYKVLVSFPISLLHDGWDTDSERVSAWVDKHLLTSDPVDPKVLAEVQRPLGQKPEGDEFLSPDHPGLQWLWDDVAKYATKSNYCYEYDKIVDKFGVPGRERQFTSKTTLNGLDLSTTVTARSQREADEKLAAVLKQVNPEAISA
jgi:hypothetical protein